jgi:uncharacterized 2Fe-2S/4Fe-4S cluster protein (DUF4445 family)
VKSEEDIRLALDLGTTTLAGRLVDRKGMVLAEAKTPNPQGIVGSDVIRRLEASLEGQGERLQSLLVEGIETLIRELLTQAGLFRSAIAAAASAGNPAICHLLRNLPVANILFPPYRPSARDGVFLNAIELGLDLPVPLYLFPLISGYVGGDLVAFLFSQQPHEPGTFWLDVGTNGEMAVFNGQEWWTTSVAAGPAFEGGQILCGMAVQPGAVERVRLRGDSLQLEVIGGMLPQGLCGSGLTEAIAAGLEGGLIDSRGKIVDPMEVTTNLSRYIVETPSGRALRLYRDATVEILLTQQDVRNFQLAKGAVKAGAECLLEKAGLKTVQIQMAVVTGAFGFSLAPAGLKRVAMLPENMVNKVRFVPGGALEGVCRFLCDPKGFVRVQALADTLRSYPLSGTPAFEKAFLRALDF